MKALRFSAAAVLATLGAGCLLTPSAHALSLGQQGKVGMQSDGSVLLPDNQRLTPAGTQVTFPGRPTAEVITRGAKTAVFLTARSGSAVSGLNGDTGELTVVDLATAQVVQHYTGAAHSVSQQGLALSADGSTLFSSTGDSTVEATSVSAAGLLGSTRSFALPTDPAIGSIQPTGLAPSADGKHLYVALNRLDALADLDPSTGKEYARTPLGVAPRDVVLQGSTAWVAEEGGPRPQLGDFQNQSTGTAAVADRYTGAASTGSVALVDLVTHRVRTHVIVGRRPSALLLSGRFLFVTDTGDDAVSVIDTVTAAVVTTFSTVPYPGLTWGSAPNAMTMLPGGRLAVSLGRPNAIAIFQWSGPRNPVALLGLVPTGWYPTDVRYDASRDRLVVANDKGVGSLAPGGTFNLPTNPAGVQAGVPSTPDSPRRVQAYLGSVSLIAVPSVASLRSSSSAVATDNGWLAADRSCPRSGVPATSIPAHLGEPSTIKHVLYVIKENRTYDQILGDDPRGDGAPFLAEFPAAITPNTHALATQFPLLDNFYDSGSLSADGHQWSVQGATSDYLERQFGSFSRSYPDQGFDSLDYLPGGFLWEKALAAGKKVVNFGEYTNEDGLNPPQHTDVPSLEGLLVPGFAGFNLQIRDIARAKIFTDNLASWTAKGAMPDLMLMTLPQDHTGGTAPGVETPFGAVADNDDALGRMVAAVSTSPFWKDTAIVVEEDDAQAGEDHVDGHRSLFLAISPYAKHTSYVDHTYYTQVNVVRTIEQILGLTPMNQLDQAAEPMRSLFTDTPDFSPYVNVTNSEPALNPPLDTLPALQRSWAQWAAGALRGGRDSADPNLLDRNIWYATHDWVTPFPGDDTMLLPTQVPTSGGVTGLAHAGVLRAMALRAAGTARAGAALGAGIPAVSGAPAGPTPLLRPLVGGARPAPVRLGDGAEQAGVLAPRLVGDAAAATTIAATGCPVREGGPALGYDQSRVVLPTSLAGSSLALPTLAAPAGVWAAPRALAATGLAGATPGVGAVLLAAAAALLLIGRRRPTRSVPADGARS